MKFVGLLIFFIPILTLGQKDGDKEIKIVVQASNGVYEKVKLTLVNSDFIIKEDGNKDTITTYSTEFNKIHYVIRAHIQKDTISLTAFSSLGPINFWGQSKTPKKYKQISYYKGNGEWKILKQVADKLGEHISYSK